LRNGNAWSRSGGVCELASLVCGRFCIAELKEYPGIVWGLGLGGVISNAASLGLTYALLKINSKIRKLDKALGQVLNHREGGARA
jgi:uncharacterized protein (DUF697 family)